MDTFYCIALLIIGCIKPNKLLYPYKVWMKIGYFLGGLIVGVF